MNELSDEARGLLLAFEVAIEDDDPQAARRHLERYIAKLEKIQAALEAERDELKAMLAAMERFIRAHDAVEIGTVSFDLQHEQVAELQAARFGVDWIGPNAAQQEKEDE